MEKLKVGWPPDHNDFTSFPFNLGCLDNPRTARPAKISHDLVSELVGFVCIVFKQLLCSLKNTGAAKKPFTSWASFFGELKKHEAGSGAHRIRSSPESAFPSPRKESEGLDRGLSGHACGQVGRRVGIRAPSRSNAIARAMDGVAGKPRAKSPFPSAI